MNPNPFRRPAMLAACSLTVAALSLGVTMPATADIAVSPVELSAEDAALSLSVLGTYESGIFDESAAEIVTYFRAAERLLVVNAALAKVEVLSIADPATPAKLFDLQTTGVLASDGSRVPAGAVANSVAVREDGLGAVAVESDLKTDRGWVVFFDAAGSGEALGAVRVGALPDMLTFTPDGTRLVVANEGEPGDDYAVDPEGSVSVIRVPGAVTAAAQADVSTADFHAFEAGGSAVLPAGVRIFGGREDAGTGVPERPVSENLEPEYATVSADSATAWVTLQEANAIAEVDLATATVVGIRDLGTVDRMSVPFDASDDDGTVAIRSWPVLGFPMPDTIDSYDVDGSTYLVTANEGDSRDWDGYSEVSRVKNLAEDGPGPVCADAFEDALGVSGVPTDADALLADEALGRLNVTTANGFDDERGCFSQLYTFGSRSMSIWDASGEQVWDSGDAFERIVAEAAPEFFNSNHSESSFDGRSDDKGPEPEGLVLGEIDGRTYAFVGFERVGGIAVFDVTVPTAATFVTYLNNRDFSVSAEDDGLAGAGDLGPEGLTFIAAEDSPTGGALLAVGNEVSGSTTLYAVEATAEAASFAVTAPADGAILDSRAVTFTGTGSVGATVGATLADGGPLGSVVPVGEDGTWSLDAVFPDSADVNQTVLLRQAVDGVTGAEVELRVTLPAAASVPTPTPTAPAPTPTAPADPDPAAPSPAAPVPSGDPGNGARGDDADALAYTGADTGLAGGAAALLMLTGAALVLLRRRRRSA